MLLTIRPNCLEDAEIAVARFRRLAKKEVARASKILRSLQHFFLIIFDSKLLVCFDLFIESLRYIWNTILALGNREQIRILILAGITGQQAG